MFKFVAETIVFAAVLLLMAVLVPAGELVSRMPDGPARRRWRFAQPGILLLLVACSAYLVAFWEQHRTIEDLAAPVALLLAAVAVAALVRLSLRSIVEVRQASVPEHSGVTDALLGIYNRNYLEHRLAEEVARSRRYGAPLSVLLFDIDHFRRVNATWGREVGDRVLNFLGHLLLMGVRESDVVARYGGEEIVVIAPSTTSAQAVVLAERLRKDVEAENLQFGGEDGGPPLLQVTVSVGVAELGGAEEEWGPMVDRANEALGQAKRAGRNRVAAA